MSVYEVKTTKDNRDAVIEALHPLGVVEERWPDGSFNFRCYDNDCEDELGETLDKLNVEYSLV